MTMYHLNQSANLGLRVLGAVGIVLAQGITFEYGHLQSLATLASALLGL
jgi:hypothetical protein